MRTAATTPKVGTPTTGHPGSAAAEGSAPELEVPYQTSAPTSTVSSRNWPSPGGSRPPCPKEAWFPAKTPLQTQGCPQLMFHSPCATPYGCSQDPFLLLIRCLPGNPQGPVMSLPRMHSSASSSPPEGRSNKVNRGRLGCGPEGLGARGEGVDTDIACVSGAFACISLPSPLAATPAVVGTTPRDFPTRQLFEETRGVRSEGSRCRIAQPDVVGLVEAPLSFVRVAGVSAG